MIGDRAAGNATADDDDTAFAEWASSCLSLSFEGSQSGWSGWTMALSGRRNLYLDLLAGNGQIGAQHADAIDLPVR